MIRSVVLLLLALALHAEILSRYEVPGMHCPLCTSAVKKSLKTLEGVKKVEVRLNTKSAAVWHDGALADEALRFS